MQWSGRSRLCEGSIKGGSLGEGILKVDLRKTIGLSISFPLAEDLRVGER
jgi:hypothetical protein